MKPMLVSSGEPAGIGPDIVLRLVGSGFPLVVLGDKKLLLERARKLGLDIKLDDYQEGVPPSDTSDRLTVLSLPCKVAVDAGVLNSSNAPYVIEMLTMAAERCLQGEFSALITAPVHKAVINQAGISFTGHTEFLADYCKAPNVVMMLVCPQMKVALVTTHLPLKDVANAITIPLILKVLKEVHRSLQKDFGIMRPKIHVSGLNPHAGEEGYLGYEDKDVIATALSLLQAEGIDVVGPFPADTMFVSQEGRACDVFVAMYHDQGLPVIKYASFGTAVNVTLGLPIIRTSVDHGTALALAGTGLASHESLLAAVEVAASMVAARLV